MGASRSPGRALRRSRGSGGDVRGWRTPIFNIGYLRLSRFEMERGQPPAGKKEINGMGEILSGLQGREIRRSPEPERIEGQQLP